MTVWPRAALWTGDVCSLGAAGAGGFEVLIANCKIAKSKILVWPASLLESGGRCLALGFPRLCEAGQVESDE